MNQVQTILSTLPEDDLQQFKKQLSTAHNRKDRIDLQLLKHLLSQEADRDAFIQKHYGDLGKRSVDAYHASHRRMGALLQRYIVQHNVGQQQGEQLGAEENLQMAQYLLDHKLYKLGWKKWRNAEEMATRGEYFPLLNRIYNLSIEYAALPEAPPLSEIELKRASNRVKIDESERINMATSLMQIKLKKIKLRSDEVDLMRVLQETLQHFNLEDALLSSPPVALKFARLLRSAYLANKDYYGLQPHMETLYEQVQSHPTDRYLREQAELLYLLAHTCYRNKFFDRALNHLFALEQLLPLISKSRSQTLRIQSVMLKAAALSFTGENLKAVDLLETMEKSPLFQHANADRANLKLNLAVYYFQQERFGDANRILAHFPNTDKWCDEHMGREWLLKKEMIWMIVQYELGNVEVSLAKIRSILRRFDRLLSRDKYVRANLFLKALRQFFTDEQKWLDSERFEQLHAKLSGVEREQEDLQAMTYFAWLKSKKLRADYYPILLEMVQK